VLEEQSPATLKDFRRQRAGWLRECAWHPGFRLRHRASLNVGLFVWTVGWLGAVAFVHMAVAVHVPSAVGLLGDLCFASYITGYALGTWHLSTGARHHPMRRALHVAASGPLVAVHSLLEASATVWALTHKPKGFHVIRKAVSV